MENNRTKKRGVAKEQTREGSEPDKFVQTRKGKKRRKTGSRTHEAHMYLARTYTGV